MINESLLRTVSIGRVAIDILEDDVYIDVYPIELQPNATGELTADTKHTNTVTNPDGNISSITVTQTNLIKAMWMPDGDTNRLEPPTVCKGEIVRLYRYGDTDIYYWQTLYNQLDLRKLEKRTIVVSNKQDIGIDKEDLLKYSYYALIDTINKLAGFHTSTTDGEYTPYDVTFDTKEGLLEVTDGKGNLIFLESRDDRWTITANKELITNTTDRYVNNSNNNVEDTKNDKTTTVGNNRTISVIVDDDLKVGGNKTVDVGTRYDIKLKNFSVDNGSDELIAVLSDFMQATADAKGVGNAMIPVPMDGGTISSMLAIKSRLDGFK